MLHQLQQQNMKFSSKTTAHKTALMSYIFICLYDILLQH